MINIVITVEIMLYLDNNIVPRSEKTCLRRFANNKGADKPEHLGRLVSAFIIAYWKVSYLNLLQAKFQFSC